MARVKTFRIHPQFGVPDREVSDFLSDCEKTMIISVATEVIPGNRDLDIDNRLTVIVTKLDDLPLESSIVMKGELLEKIE